MKPISIVEAGITSLMQLSHEYAISAGFVENLVDTRNEAELIALIHSELSEALEYLRHGNPPSDHLPEFSGAEEEFADVLIRVADHCAGRGYRLAEAVIAKMAYNKMRGYRHGKQF